MIDNMNQLVIDSMPYLIAIIIVAYIVNWLYSMAPDTSEKEREKKTPLERYYNALISHINVDNMKSGEKLKLRGDSNIPGREIGGLVGATKRRNFFILGIRDYMWIIPKFWKEPTLLFVPDEFIHDLHQGDVMIDEAVGLDVINEMFSTVAVAEENSDYEDKELQRKVQNFIDMDIKRILAIDLNNDIIENAKAGLRGGRQYSEMERLRPEKPPKKDVEEIEKERKQKEAEFNAQRMQQQRQKQQNSGNGGI